VVDALAAILQEAGDDARFRCGLYQLDVRLAGGQEGDAHLLVGHVLHVADGQPQSLGVRRQCRLYAPDGNADVVNLFDQDSPLHQEIRDQGIRKSGAS